MSQGNKGAEHYIKERSQELRCDGGVNGARMLLYAGTVNSAET